MVYEYEGSGDAFRQQLLNAVLQVYSNHPAAYGALEPRLHGIGLFLAAFPAFENFELRLMVLKTLEYVSIGLADTVPELALQQLCDLLQHLEQAACSLLQLLCQIHLLETAQELSCSGTKTNTDAHTQWVGKPICTPRYCYANEQLRGVITGVRRRADGVLAQSVA